MIWAIVGGQTTGGEGSAKLGRFVAQQLAWPLHLSLFAQILSLIDLIMEL